MNRAMITASSTMAQLQRQLDTIGNNLANVDTNGFKRRDARFGELLTQQLNNQVKEDEEIGRRTPNGIRQTVGARVSETSLRMDLGSIKQTGRALDVAILNKSHFLQVAVEENGVEETRLTRDGALYLSPTGNGESLLVTGNGNPVLGTDGAILVPENITDISIDEQGNVIVENLDRTKETVAQLELVDVIRPQLLLSAGENQYRLPNLEELELTEEDVLTILGQQDVQLQSRSLESSNVDVSKEMTDMMIAQKSYSFNAKAIATSDQMMGLINNLR